MYCMHTGWETQPHAASPSGPPSLLQGPTKEAIIPGHGNMASKHELWPLLQHENRQTSQQVDVGTYTEPAKSCRKKSQTTDMYRRLINSRMAEPGSS